MNSLLQDKKRVLALGGLGAVAVLAAAWFLVVSPQRSKATDLEGKVAAAKSELDQRRRELSNPAAAITVKAGDTYRLVKALPNSVGMAGMILDINRIAARHKLAFTSIAPGGPVVATGFVAQPVGIEVQGRFAEVSGFLGDLRRLVQVNKRRLDARGRLYSTTNVAIGEAESKFPNVKATLTIESYTFSPPPAGSAATTPQSSTPSTDATVAAGANP